MTAVSAVVSSVPVSVQASGLDLQAVKAAIITLRQVVKDLNSNLIEREAAVDMMVTATLAREHICFIGEPGGAKSMMINGWAKRIVDSAGVLKVFEQIVSRFMTLEDLLGPVSLTALKDEERYKRNVADMLPEAHFAILDEIWESGPGILTATNQMINERKIVNGGMVYQLPLISVFAASNRIPVEPSYRAVWDRFMFRARVDDLSDDGFAKLIGGECEHPGIDDPIQATMEYNDLLMLQEAVSAVQVPEGIQKILLEIRQELATAGIHPSPRRWKKSIKLLRAFALLRGSLVVRREHLKILVDVLWIQEQQRAMVAEVIERKSQNQYTKEAIKIHDQSDGILKACLQTQANIKQQLESDVAQKNPSMMMNLRKQKAENIVAQRVKIKSNSVAVVKLYNQAKQAGEDYNEIAGVSQKLKDMLNKIDALDADDIEDVIVTASENAQSIAGDDLPF